MDLMGGRPGQGLAAPDGVGAADGVESAMHETRTPPSRAPAAGFSFLDTTAVPTGYDKYMNKGDLSNVATFVVMVLGLILGAQLGYDTAASKYVLAVGLFGFAGGITNWLAVKMLFDHIPFLYGSGVIPRNFEAIIASVKEMIMKMFFDGDFLKEYINQRSKGLVGQLDLGAQLKTAFAGPEVDARIAAKLQEVADTHAQGSQEGMMVKMMLDMFGGGVAPEGAAGPGPGAVAMAPMVKPMMAALGEEMISMLAENFDITTVITLALTLTLTLTPNPNPTP